MDTRKPHYNPEVWGGIECTINRVGDRFSDQLALSGCYVNTSYIDAIASLGIRAFRFPVLWEQHQREKNQEIDFSWARAQLEQIRLHGIQPIVGLVHHGSGPAFTALHRKDFAVQLAGYARKVAEQFPWIEYYTPVNEPLTTARFSGLYGLWYPHRRNAKAFLTMLLHQLKGVVLSMEAIREINPRAKLVQTEDLAKVHSTPLLRYQRDFENRRRWLTYDILCGNLNSRHPLWKYMRKAGISKEELQFFQQHPCPPDIVGLNYYITSERYLDENRDLYPAYTHGGNGLHRYADVEAVRVTARTGIRRLLGEAWDRYKLPIALTEVHLNCTREEQLRWLAEIWDEARAAIRDGVNLKAVTAWSMLGAYNWNSLLTRDEGHYEPGVFDHRDKMLRKTALAKMVRSLATGKSYEHPLLQEKGWWHHDQRLLYKPAVTAAALRNIKTPPLLIMGKSGTLGSAFARICEKRRIPYVTVSRQDADMLNDQDLERVINLWKPWAVVNATGYVRVDEAESDSRTCFDVNAIAPSLMAWLCREHSIPFMSFSSDLVFDGNKHLPYVETDDMYPLNVYGKSKAEGERLIREAYPAALIIRTSAFFGPWDRYNFAHLLQQALQAGNPFEVVEGMKVSPTYVPDLVNASLDLLIDEEKGIWHLSNDGDISWVDFANEIASRAKLPKRTLQIKPAEEMPWKAQRPVYSVLQSGKGMKLPVFHNALDRYFHEKVA